MGILRGLIGDFFVVFAGFIHWNVLKGKGIIEFVTFSDGCSSLPCLNKENV